MNIFKKLITTIYAKIFSVLKSAYEAELRRKTFASYSSNTIIGEGTIIESSASIINNKTNGIIIGKQNWICGQLLLVNNKGEIIIGDHCFISVGSRIWSAKKISIGNRVLISHNVNIIDNNSHPLSAEERHKNYLSSFANRSEDTYEIREKEIEIGDDVWIGFNATILKGVKIGNGAIIGANAIITKDVPDYAVVIGEQQKIIKYTN
jgi:acetyltransferase-like isoleucine patch superfamily enzyme